jgi:uncharacterized protein YciI
MPLFAIHALDHQNALPLRLEHYAAHRAYVESAEAGGPRPGGIRVVLSGPLQSDDGEMMIGSLFIVEAESQTQVAAFTAADPFTVQGIWASVTIARFHKRKG